MADCAFYLMYIEEKGQEKFKDTNLKKIECELDGITLANKLKTIVKKEEEN